MAGATDLLGPKADRAFGLKLVAPGDDHPDRAAGPADFAHRRLQPARRAGERLEFRAIRRHRELHHHLLQPGVLALGAGDAGPCRRLRHPVDGDRARHGDAAQPALHRPRPGSRPADHSMGDALAGDRHPVEVVCRWQRRRAQRRADDARPHPGLSPVPVRPEHCAADHRHRRGVAAGELPASCCWPACRRSPKS